MSTDARRKAARERLAAQRERERHRAQRAKQRRAFAIVGVVVLFFGLLVALKLAGVGDKGSAKKTGALDPAVLAQVTGVPATTFATVGAGADTKQPTVLPGPDLVQSGKPKVVYIGAEYCPFCAAQRWPLVVALSRFGTWNGLSATTSAADDVFPNTATFSFHGATYTSDHLVFEGVETNTNQKVGGTYGPLDKLTKQQTELLNTFNAPPYVPAQYAGSIPFLDLGNRWMLSGASVSPDLLTERTIASIAQDLSNPSSKLAQAILGSANRITATLCSLTHNQPAAVCTAAPIPALEAALPHA
jgi:hypothetical protein